LQKGGQKRFHHTANKRIDGSNNSTNGKPCVMYLSWSFISNILYIFCEIVQRDLALMNKWKNDEGNGKVDYYEVKTLYTLGREFPILCPGDYHGKTISVSKRNCKNKRAISTMAHSKFVRFVFPSELSW